MATRTSTNPYDGLNQSLSGIGQIFTEIPKYEAIGAQRDLALAGAAEKNTQMQAQGAIGATLQKFMTLPPEQRPAAAAQLAQGVIQSGGNASQIGALFRAGMSMNPNATDADKLNAAVGAGDAVGENSAFSVGGQNRIAGRNSALKAQETLTVENNKNRELGAGQQLIRPDGTIIASGLPTTDTENAKTLQTMSGPERKQKVLGDRTPRNYQTGDGAAGITLDGQTDANTGAPLPGGSQIFSSQLNATDSDGLNKSGKNKLAMEGGDLNVNEEKITRIENTIKKYPGQVTGLSGAVIRGMQDSNSALGQLVGTLGDKDIIKDQDLKNALHSAADAMSPAGAYNEELTKARYDWADLVFAKAKSISGGGNISKTDIAHAVTQLGDGTLTGNDNDALAKLAAMRQDIADQRGKITDLTGKKPVAPQTASSSPMSTPAIASPNGPDLPIGDAVANIVAANPQNIIPAAAMVPGAGPYAPVTIPAAPPPVEQVTPVMSGVAGAPGGQVAGPAVTPATMPVRINNEADWAALQPGTPYMAPDGQIRSKR